MFSVRKKEDRNQSRAVPRMPKSCLKREKRISQYEKLQKDQKAREIVIVEKIAEYAGKNSLCAVPGPVSRLMDAEQIVC